MASASLSPRLASSSYSPKVKCCSFSISLISNPRPTNVHFSKCIPQLGIFKFSSWNGLRQLNLPTSKIIFKLERKRRCKGVYASLFGVGAPEALVIGVVALLVFGPKGLAEVARNLGKTLRDFQPTIRELQEVSRDFKSTLEREIGLDEIQETTKPTTSTRPTANAEDFDFVKPNTPSKLPPLPEASLGREDVKIREEQVEAATAELPAKLPPLPGVSLGREDGMISDEQVEAATAEPQVTDGSVLTKESETQEYLKQLEEQVQALLAEKQRKFAPAAAEVKFQDTSSFSTEAPLTEDNAKTKEHELEELTAQKHDTSFSTEASFTENNINTKEQELEELAVQKQEDTSFSTEASFTEDNVKTKEEELEELAAQKHDEAPVPTDSQAEPQSQSEGTEVTWTTKGAETQEYLKKLEEEVQELLAEKQKQTLAAVAEVNPEDIQEAASISSPSQNSENQA